MGLGIIGGVLSLGSSLLGASASKKAGSTQDKAGQAAADQIRLATSQGTQAQREQYDIGRQDLQPYRDVGSAALQRLAGTAGIQTTQTTAGPRELPTLTTEERISGLRRAAQVLGDLPSSNNQFLGYGTPEAVIAKFAPEVFGDRLGPEEGTVTVAAQADPEALSPVQASLAETDELLAGFKTSPGYEFRRDEALSAADRSARASGLSLSGGAQIDLQRRADGLASAEYNNFANQQFSRFDQYLNRLAGLAGAGQQAAG